ncbi:beta strand repeat-containing protein [Teichococcus aestuarii]|uniref:beta strand repeat-containing protein n=1 Tax=Teichococcus aestuarii TaxID=568898 RepID=UPI003610D84F
MSEAFAADYFDEQYYLRTNPDVLLAITSGHFNSAYEHFQQFGQFEMRAPNVMFDAASYLLNNPDVLAAVSQGLIPSAWYHFVNFGVKEGRSGGSFEGQFSEEAYLAANPDVAAAVENGDFASGYAHYLLFGANEGRPAFNTDGSTVTPGETFYLTAGKDTFTGTSGEDTFVAEGYSPTDSSQQTQINALDSIDGGAGTDTLNIAVAGTANSRLAGTVSNVEIINIDNTEAAAAAAHSGGSVDASKFRGATQIWQIGDAATVINLAETTTAGFRDQDDDVTVIAADDATSVMLAVDNVDAGSFDFDEVSGESLASVTLRGTVSEDSSDTPNLDIIAGTDVEAVTIDTEIDVSLDVNEAGASTRSVNTVDASASTGAIEFSADSATTSVLTGSGDDELSLNTATARGGAAASLNSGAGDDTIRISTTGTGTTTVNAGEGSDSVSISGRGTGVLTVNLGAGDDSFESSVAINGSDVIDAGAGTDTLLLSLVGSANIGAFRGFDVFDVKDLGKTLDVGILAQNNSVTDFVGSGSSNAGVLQNIGSGIGFRATGDMGTGDTLSLTQATAGSLTVTLDADETGTADTTIDTAGMAINVTNARTLSAVFDADYLAGIDGETTSGDNVSTIALTGVATSLSIMSGGDNASNVVTYTDSATTDVLASVSVTGDRALDLSGVTSTALASVDASGLSGALTFSLAQLKDGGSLALGGGNDLITVTNASTTGAFESVSGLGANDQLVLAAASVAADVDSTGTYALADGVLAFEGTGPSTFDEALGIVDGALALNAAAVFEYLSDSYLFVQGTTDTLVKLTGLTSVDSLTESTTSADHFMIA